MEGTARKKLTQAQKIALLKGCGTSGLTIRKYAALNNVRLSTLVKRSTQIGISLRKQTVQAGNPPQLTETSNKTDGARGSHDSFSFIDITDRSSFIPAQAPEKVLLSNLEIHMPNGMMLKVEQIPFDRLLSQLAEFTRSLSHV